VLCFILVPFGTHFMRDKGKVKKEGEGGKDDLACCQPLYLSPAIVLISSLPLCHRAFINIKITVIY